MQTVINALSLGGLYALAALGVALIFGVMRLINFAHGGLIMLSAYGLWLWSGHPVALTLLLTVAVAVVAALAMERLAFRPLRGADTSTLLVASFFVSSLVENGWIAAYGSLGKSVSVFPGLLDRFDIGGLTLYKLDVVTLGTTAALLVACSLVLTRTLIGLQIRAASENFVMARLLGVRANRVIPAAFAMSGVLAAPVAILLVARTGYVYPDIGLTPVLIAFLATVLGGMGNLVGAVAAGFLLGALTTGLQTLLPESAAAYRDAFVFGGVLLMLVWRPRGLLPTRFEAEPV